MNMTAIAGKTRVIAQVARGGIQSDAELDQATRRLCRLLSIDRKPTREEEKQIRFLTNAIEAYEDKHYSIPEPTAAALLSHLLDAKGATAAQLASESGITVRDISAILNGKRDIRQGESAAFARYFNVDASVFDLGAPSVTTEVVTSTAEPATVVEAATVAETVTFSRSVLSSSVGKWMPHLVRSSSVAKWLRGTVRRGSIIKTKSLMRVAPGAAFPFLVPEQRSAAAEPSRSQFQTACV
jgi:HTH-type transcriptional regulator/antitoxin HigA